ncbi:MAG TPA: hydrogenase maturation nickel metallochaperone HypA [Anaerolineales bacterium]|nr:hydrogenase maturation nickel metallochaperone HypA [Anaerolineales bacterium]
MHELSVTESLLEIALRHGKSANASHITDLYLVIGQLSSLIDDSVQFYWDIVSKDTLAEGANLHFQRISTQIRCLDCASCFVPAGEDLSCPNCLSTRIEVTAGEEFFLEAINVET